MLDRVASATAAASRNLAERQNERPSTKFRFAAPACGEGQGPESTLPTSCPACRGGNAGTAHDERQMDVEVVGALLPAGIRNCPRETVVRREHDVGVVELAVVAQGADELVDAASTACSDWMRPGKVVHASLHLVRHDAGADNLVARGVRGVVVGVSAARGTRSGRRREVPVCG